MVMGPCMLPLLPNSPLFAHKPLEGSMDWVWGMGPLNSLALLSLLLTSSMNRSLV
jgi:hypothetical protein